MVKPRHEKLGLFTLPVELQLQIYEMVVIADEPLLLNCGCDSSYIDEDDWAMDTALWEAGDKHPPYQPALTQTCKAIRSMTIPMFYRRNVFRAHYCYAADVDMALSWLSCIGPENRIILKDLCFWDKNPRFDMQRDAQDLKKLRRGRLRRDYGGTVMTLQGNFPCHRVSFVEGGWFQHLEGFACLFEG